MTRTNKIFKDMFDFFGAIVGLSIVFPLIALAWVVASIDTRSNGFFIQQRVGKGGTLFSVIKIKSMKKVNGINTTITSSGDARITKCGVFFRKTKIDELPQLWNVLIRQMSFVGPRPDVPGYADRLQGGDRIILSVRPGITGPAQLAYKDEEKILANQSNAVEYNDKFIWPNKVKINREYIENYSFFKDFYYIWKTIVGDHVKY